MTPEQHKHFKFCVEQLGMRIYPVPLYDNSRDHYIEVEFKNGRKKTGTEKYNNKEVYNKIHELYKQYYELNKTKFIEIQPEQ